jgi:undecaprenyl diphosphate synthase
MGCSSVRCAAKAKKLNVNDISLRIVVISAFILSCRRQWRVRLRRKPPVTSAFVLPVAANYGGQWDIAQAAGVWRVRCKGVAPDILQSCKAVW